MTARDGNATRPTTPLVRLWREADLRPIAWLYYDTVRLVNARHYTPAQIAAWAPEVYPEDYWRRRFATRRAFVAELDGVVAGFAELEPPGHVDCFYVHHALQGRHVGSALMQRLLDEGAGLGAKRLHANVGVTARAFFESQGFVVLREQARSYRGQRFRQFLMERRL